MSDPIQATCLRKYTAAHDSGYRSVKNIKWIVLHSTEGDTAEGAAAWFANPASSGSAHIVVDDTTCFRTLTNDQIPWAAPGANELGFHIEQAGHARWTRAQWLVRELTIQRAAYKAAVHAKLFNIPLRWVGPLGLKLGRKGVTTHLDCTKAFGGDHTDPGVDYPKDVFMLLAKQFAEGL